jgi:DNA-binding response OmpR family regulator
MSAKILVVEDENTLRDAYEMILESGGYIVKTAGNGGVALEILESFEADLILLDLRMPHVSGIDFLRKFNTDESIRPKIIVFSNIDSQDEIHEAYKHGADRYMLKAWASPKELLSLVSEVLNDESSSTDHETGNDDISQD